MLPILLFSGLVYRPSISLHLWRLLAQVEGDIPLLITLLQELVQAPPWLWCEGGQLSGRKGRSNLAMVLGFCHRGRSPSCAGGSSRGVHLRHLGPRHLS